MEVEAQEGSAAEAPAGEPGPAASASCEGGGGGGSGGGGSGDDGVGAAAGGSHRGSAACDGPGMARLLRYMERIKPAEAAEAAPSASTREHLYEAPRLLPSVIFQELVFGRELGTGSFSTVRYCKHVVRGTSASAWPEYAAKVSCRARTGWHFCLAALASPRGGCTFRSCVAVP